MAERKLGDWLQLVLKPPLLVFALVSIGFAIGRLTGPAAAAPEAAPDQAEGPGLTVTYFHGNVRCKSCNGIQDQLETIMQEHYGEAIADGRLTYRTINFDVDERLAKRFGISYGMPVITWEDALVLEEVWGVKDDPEAFSAYIRGSIDAQLSEVQP